MNSQALSSTGDILPTLCDASKVLIAANELQATLSTFNEDVKAHKEKLGETYVTEWDALFQEWSDLRPKIAEDDEKSVIPALHLVSCEHAESMQSIQRRARIYQGVYTQRVGKEPTVAVPAPKGEGGESPLDSTNRLAKTLVIGVAIVGGSIVLVNLLKAVRG